MEIRDNRPLRCGECGSIDCVKRYHRHTEIIEVFGYCNKCNHSAIIGVELIDKKAKEVNNFYVMAVHRSF